MCLSVPKSVKAYQTLTGELVLLNDAELASHIEHFGGRDKIPHEVKLNGKWLTLEYDALNPVYELKGDCEVTHLSTLTEKMVRCSNCK